MAVNAWLPPLSYSFFHFLGLSVFSLYFIYESRHAQPKLSWLDSVFIAAICILLGKVSSLWVMRWVTGEMGLSFFISAVGAALGVYVYTRTVHISLLRVGDIGVPAAALSFAILKLGCLAAGCCYGVETRGWLYARYETPLTGVTTILDQHPHLMGAHVVPLQLYVSLLSLFIWVLSLWLKPGTLFKPGQRFALCLALYALGRWAIDLFSGERAVFHVGSWNENQVFACVMFLMATLLYAKIERRYV